MNHHLRVARPVADPTHSAKMYCAALGLELLSSFQNHQGFDGKIVGTPGVSYHFEFTASRNHRVEATPTAEDLIVLYISNRLEWENICSSMLAAGFTEVQSFNPYWDVNGKTFHSQLQGLRRFMLATSTAHGLYKKVGFAAPVKPHTLMEKFLPNAYRNAA